MNRQIPPVVASASRPAARPAAHPSVDSSQRSVAPALAPLPIAPVSLSAVSAPLPIAPLSFQRNELIERIEERINRLEAVMTEPLL